MVQVKTKTPRQLFKTKRDALLSAGLLFAALLFFSLGVVVEKMDFTGKVFKPVLKNNIKILTNYLEGLNARPERITIDIKHTNYQKLAYQRKKAFAETKLFASSDDYVPAVINHRGKATKVEMRLKGDHLDHLSGKKWSFRIKTKGNHTLFGMKKFSIHRPKTRNFLHEWVYHQALKREGIIALRYKFIDVTINGEHLGIYALEEHFEKRLVENNKLKEGPIIRFNENLMWEEKVQQQSSFKSPVEQNGSGSYYSSDIDSFNTGKTFADPKLKKLFVKAVSLLEAFRKGDISASQAFDIEKMAKFFAISDLLGSHHGVIWHNMRFYYNPTSSKLEPVGFDGNSGKFIQKLVFKKKYELYTELFKDTNFFEIYLKTLESFDKDQFLKKLIKDLAPGIKENLAILHRDYPSYRFSKKPFYQNNKYIKTVLNPIKFLHAYFKEKSNNKIEIKIGNIQSLPIEILHLSYNKNKEAFKLKSSTERIILRGKYGKEPTDYKVLDFILPAGFRWSEDKVKDLSLVYKVLGTSIIREEKIFNWDNLDEANLATDLMLEAPNYKSFSFIKTDLAAKKIYIKKGSWKLNRNLIVPKGFTFIAEAGTRLDLSNQAKILSYSALEFIGTADMPITIESKDGSGQGILVIAAKENSLVRHVIFNNLSNPKQANWSVSGAVTFYEAPVKISYSQFANNRSEDALNVVRTNMTVEETMFINTFSDAFDGDFINGRIVRSSFVNSGNDAVDVSGSNLVLKDLIIKQSGDKALSAGENSEMRASGIEIDGSEIAVASKDMSKVEINNLIIKNSKVAFTAFQKKPEFGPGKILITGLEMDNIEEPYLIEDKSSLVIDQKVITSKKASSKNVKSILYGVQYGKKSKR